MSIQGKEMVQMWSSIYEIQKLGEDFGIAVDHITGKKIVVAKKSRKLVPRNIIGGLKNRIHRRRKKETENEYPMPTTTGYPITSTPKNREEKRGKLPCRFFNTPKGCRRDNCRHEHVVATSEQKRKMPCPYLKSTQGCRANANCQFSHDQSNRHTKFQDQSNRFTSQFPQDQSQSHRHNYRRPLFCFQYNSLTGCRRPNCRLKHMTPAHCLTIYNPPVHSNSLESWIKPQMGDDGYCVHNQKQFNCYTVEFSNAQIRDRVKTRLKEDLWKNIQGVNITEHTPLQAQSLCIR